MHAFTARRTIPSASRELLSATSSPFPDFTAPPRPHHAATREEYICYWRVDRAVLGQLLVLTIAGSFATLEGRSAAARTAVWSVITQCRAYNVGYCGGLVRMCGVRRVLSPMLQTCLRSTYFLTALQWVAFLVPLWRCSVSLSEGTWD